MDYLGLEPVPEERLDERPQRKKRSRSPFARLRESFGKGKDQPSVEARSRDLPADYPEYAEYPGEAEREEEDDGWWEMCVMCDCSLGLGSTLNMHPFSRVQSDSIC